MRWKLDVKLQTLILLVVIPCLLLATVIFGWLIYGELYNVILYGFEQKLMAISTVTGSFVTGQDHDRILLKRNLSSLAFDPNSHNLFGYDTETHELVRVDARTGAAWSLGPDDIDEARGAIIHPIANPFSIDSAGRLMRANPTTGDNKVIGRLLLAPEPDTSLTPEQRGHQQPAPIVLNALAFDTNLRRLYGSGDGLVDIDTATGIARRGDFPVGFRNEHSKDYLKYVIPIRRIMRKKDITYLYTQLLAMGGKVTYGFDGTVGDQHSALGAEDQLPIEELQGTEHVLTADSVHLTAIRKWEQWGLLKSAFAPIYWPNSEIKGMAGADVNISVISERTRVALAEVGLIAAIILVLSGFVSLKISRKLVEPLADVKQGALRVTAGDYGFQLKSQSLDELQQLAQEFNRMSVTMRWTLEELTETNRGLEATRRRRELELALADSSGLPARDSGIHVYWTGAGKIKDASGCVSVPDDPDRAIIWMCEAAPTPITALRLRREIHSLTTRLLRKDVDWHEVAERIMHVYDSAIYSVMLLDAKTGAIESRSRRAMPATIIAGDSSRGIDISSVRINLAIGETLALASDGNQAGKRGIGADATHEREKLVVAFSMSVAVPQEVEGA
jgi:HAMP domain-containing protein